MNRNPHQTNSDESYIALLLGIIFIGIGYTNYTNENNNGDRGLHLIFGTLMIAIGARMIASYHPNTYNRMLEIFQSNLPGHEPSPQDSKNEDEQIELTQSK